LGGLGQPDEDTIVDLEKTEELEDLARLRGNLVDTNDSKRKNVQRMCRSILPLDSDDEDKLGLLLDIEATLLLAQASESDLLALSVAVFLDISLGPLEDDLAFLFVDLIRHTLDLCPIVAS
jgi:cyanophycinase-like exopeptidase